MALASLQPITTRANTVQCSPVTIQTRLTLSHGLLGFQACILCLSPVATTPQKHTKKQLTGYEVGILIFSKSNETCPPYCIPFSLSFSEDLRALPLSDLKLFKIQISTCDHFKKPPSCPLHIQVK